MKRRRTQNTTKEQFELYLSFMESDYAFRSGTINPTLGDNYIAKKWQELANMLNALGSGPNLSPDEWKKVKYIEILFRIIFFKVIILYL